LSKARSEPDLSAQRERAGARNIAASTPTDSLGIIGAASETVGALDLNGESCAVVQLREIAHHVGSRSWDIEEMRSHIRRLVELRKRQVEAQERSRFAHEMVQKVSKRIT
jgi:hypothetical protein